MDLKYKFNAKEYATLNGITPSALRKRRLSGKLDGQYIKSCPLDTLPTYSNSKTIKLFDNNGYDGKLSNLRFYRRALKMEEISSQFNSGYNYYSLITLMYNLFGNNADVVQQ